MKRTLTILAVMLLLVPALFAQGTKEATPAATTPAVAAPAPAAAPAANAGSVNAYTTLEEPLAAKLFQLFEAETGIKVNFVRLSGGECVARLEAEASNPQASIWVGGVGLDHITAKSKGLTTPYVSRFTAKTPVQFRDPDNFFIGLYVGPLTFVTNTERAKELGLTPPKSWADLLKPEYKGYIRMANPNTSGTAYNVLTTMLDVFGTEDKMIEYMTALDKNIDQYTKSGSAPGKSVATGEIPVAIGYAHDQVKLKAAGSPVVITAPSEGTGYELASMSMVKGGKDTVNAKKLYDWILSSPDAQKTFTEWYVVLVAEGAAKHPDALSINEINTVTQDMAWDGDSVNKTRLLDRWTNEIGNKR
ncbi:ABC-type Fe3+ transport system, periplasmic component [Sphaerochaeta pleomorpha str. Grapes]|uniref:ABC-type Fe3+ transport system, periplasmic component n=1 Tax=Sphaerochaeta pleomorpha (strain ATCC BAA-1885 / DSM 22778 / Grapes) TaxID=158190 RepID=G8QQA8_SPHPG|nr:ABC transporter substrate-binding protein [Sphaerochaeta pleomorpha]AEV29753.1 ABC-type Fe3+ transport system, periplasmic component [Sphaerochaeta pleomorpha str. Grapes]